MHASASSLPYLELVVSCVESMHDCSVDTASDTYFLLRSYRRDKP